MNMPTNTSVDYKVTPKHMEKCIFFLVRKKKYKDIMLSFFVVVNI